MMACNSYMTTLFESSRRVMEDIKSDEFQKKIFNFIKNDFAGILNGFNNENITFEYNDSLTDIDFLKKVVEILQECNFKEQRYDKKGLKEKLQELFAESIQNETFVVGKRELQNAYWFPLCDRELKFLIYITNFYD